MSDVRTLPPPESPPPNGNGPSSSRLAAVEVRLAALEAHFEHVATKADLEKAKSDLIKWMMGAIAVSTMALTAAVIRSMV
ncbi:MAG: hypothetical protein OXH52_10545 [Gammaproteobacteria bacterium]|nr:hypothetical protein [Gammaproteobacteria bacterium]